MADKTDSSLDPHAHDDHGHGGDDHGHGHDDHASHHGSPVPSDMIPEGSWQDVLLMFIAGAALMALLWAGFSACSGIKAPEGAPSESSSTMTGMPASH